MKYTDKLLKHPEFQKKQKEISEWERERIYCHHEISHALDVCRMAWILYLEQAAEAAQPFCATAEREKEKRSDREQLWKMKDRIYVTGLLHDIGRVRQYACGEHHAAAGGEIAAQLLRDIGYPDVWMQETLAVIAEHHGRKACEDAACDQIAYLIRKADHLSRNCFCCEAADSCKWKEEERNRTIIC